MPKQNADWPVAEADRQLAWNLKCFVCVKTLRLWVPSAVDRVGRQVSVQVVSQDGAAEEGEWEQEKQEEESHIENTGQCCSWKSLSN